MKKNIVFLITAILVSIPILFLVPESLYKALFLLLLIWSWFYLGWRCKNYTKISILYTFLILPLNLTIQILPTLLPVLNTSSYVSGLSVNYLIPTVSVLDLFAVLIVISGFVEGRNIIRKVTRSPFLIALGLLFLIQILYVQETTTLFSTLRIFLYLIGSVFSLKFLQKKKLLRNLLQQGYVKGLLLCSVLLQFFVGLYQFSKGASLGVYFLGESHVVNGMLNSSFIDISGEIFLRAYGTFPHPNILAGWLLLMTVIILLSFKKSLLEYVALIFISLLMVLTFSRISMLLYIFILLLFFLSRAIKRESLLSLSGLLWIRFMNVFNGDSSWVDRVKLFKLNIEILKENVLLGTGIGNSLRYYDGRIPYTDAGRLLVQPVHNVFLLSFVEMGIAVALYFWFVIYRFFIKGVRWEVLKVGIVIILVVVGMFDHYLLSLPQGLVILFSFLLLLSY